MFNNSPLNVTKMFGLGLLFAIPGFVAIILKAPKQEDELTWVLSVATIAVMLAVPFSIKQKPTCAGCGEKLGKPHLPSCYREGVVALASIEREKKLPPQA